VQFDFEAEIESTSVAGKNSPRRAKKISVGSRLGVWFNVDGKLVGNEPAVFEVLPRALEFVVSNR
jgi:diacylglycerol kinase family enzyme